MREEFRKLFLYGVEIAEEKGYLDDMIESNPKFKEKFADDNGHFDWDMFWDSYNFWLENLLGD